MDTAKRLRYIKTLDKMAKNPEFSKKIGIKNTSRFYKTQECRKQVEK